MRIPRRLYRALARTKPFVPDQLWPLVHVVRSVARHDRPLVGTPSFTSALVLAAHPDDECVGCGGLMALLADAGSRVDVLYATDGEATTGTGLESDEIARRRRREGEAACAILGAQPPRFLGLPDGDLSSHADALRKGVANTIDELDPEIVIAPWELDGHADHQAVSAAVPLGIPVWWYEAWTPLPPNRLVDVTSVFDRVERALACHVTARLTFDVSAMLGLARYRSAFGLMGEGYAEAYLAR